MDDLYEGVKREFPSLSEEDAKKATAVIYQTQLPENDFSRPVQTLQPSIQDPENSTPQTAPIVPQQRASSGTYQDYLREAGSPEKIKAAQQKFNEQMQSSPMDKIAMFLSMAPRGGKYAGLISKYRNQKLGQAQGELGQTLESAKLYQEQQNKDREFQINREKADREATDYQIIDQMRKDPEVKKLFINQLGAYDKRYADPEVQKILTVMSPERVFAYGKEAYNRDKDILGRGTSREEIAGRTNVANIAAAAKNRATDAQNMATMARLELESPEAIGRKEKAKINAETFAKTQNNLRAVDEQIDMLDDAFNTFKNYSKGSMFGGTGPIATGFGLKQFTDEDTQNVQAKFNMINLKNMAQTFQGMSRAIDSDAERRAWEATQPNIKNDDKVNYNILLGSKSLAMKAKLEAQAQRKWMDSGQPMESYTSPVFGKTVTLVSPKGELIVVRKEEAPKYKGYMTIDQYAGSQ